MHVQQRLLRMERGESVFSQQGKSATSAKHGRRQQLPQGGSTPEPCLQYFQPMRGSELLLEREKKEVQARGERLHGASRTLMTWMTLRQAVRAGTGLVA